MIIERINIQNMRSIVEREIRLTSGLNIVFGPNESGKSTTFEAILLGLFDFPTGKKTEQDIIPWGQSSSPILELQLKLQNDDEATIYKNYDNQTARIKFQNQDITTKSKIEQWLVKHLGTDNKNIFSNSLHVSQASFSGISNEKNIVDEVWRIISSEAGDISIDSALSDLEKAKKELGRGINDRVRTNFGKIREAQDQIKDLRDQIADSEDKLHKYDKNNEEVDSLTDDLRQLDHDISSTTDQIDNINKKQTLQQELDDIESNFQNLDKRISTLRSLNIDYKKKKQEFEKYKLFKNFTDNQFTEIERLHKNNLLIFTRFCGQKKCPIK